VRVTLRGVPSLLKRVVLNLVDDVLRQAGGHATPDGAQHAGRRPALEMTDRGLHPHVIPRGLPSGRMEGAGTTPIRRGQCLLLAAALLGPARAEALVVDLPGALSLARTQNPTVRIAVADLEAARGQRRQAGLWPTNPVLWTETAAHTVGSTPFFDRGI